MQKAVLLFLGWVCASQIFAQQPVVVAVSEIPNLLSKDPEKQGLYNRFIESIPDISLLYIAPARVEVEFNKGYINCLFPASKVTMENRSNLVESNPIQHVSAYLFAETPLNAEQLVKSSRVGIRRGFVFGRIRSKLNVDFVELQSDLETATFLELKRIDAFIAYLPDAKAAYQSLNKPLPIYDVNRPLYTANEAFVCHKTEQNIGFINKVNPLIRHWQNNRSLNSG